MTNGSMDMIQITGDSNHVNSQLIYQYLIEHIDRWDVLFFVFGLFFLLYMIYYLKFVDYPEKYTSHFTTTWIIFITLYLCTFIIDLVNIGGMKHIVFGAVLFTISITVTYLQTRQKFVDEITESKINIYKNDVQKLRYDIKSKEKSISDKNVEIKKLKSYKLKYTMLENDYKKLEQMYAISIHKIEALNLEINSYTNEINQYKHDRANWEQSLIDISDTFEDFTITHIPYNYRVKYHSMGNASNHTIKLLNNCNIMKEYIEIQHKILKNKVSELSELELLYSTESERLRNKYPSEDFALYVFNPIFGELKEIVNRKNVSFIYDMYPYYSEHDVMNILIRVLQNLEKQNMFMRTLSIIRKKT